MAGGWHPCDQCGGACIADAASCLAHAGTAERAAALKQFSESGDLDLRGVMISDALLKEIFDTAPHNADGRPVFSAFQLAEATFKGEAEFEKAIFGRAGFEKVTFQGDAGFGGATFEHTAGFFEVTFEDTVGFFEVTFEDTVGFFEVTFKGGARFTEATFKGHTMFTGATFQLEAAFGGATFQGKAEFDLVGFEGAWFSRAAFEGDAVFDGADIERNAVFDGVTFQGDAGFLEVTFKGEAGFRGATFQDNVRFAEAAFEHTAGFDAATFEGHAGFNGATFEGDAVFTEATFKGDAVFTWATIKREAVFDGATFQGEVPTLGPVTVEGRLDLDRVQFASAVRIDADASALTCRRARFDGGVRLEIRRATIRLDDSDFSVPSLLTGPAAGNSAGVAGQPRLLSLNGTNVAGLALGNISLADCRFAGAHNLDRLRLEADTVFGLSPAMAGWERRQVIAEEATYRAASARPGRWEAPPWPYSEDQPTPLSPGAIAGLYRALRKGREDAKDEPGAADLYYGEMEMRRQDRGTGPDRGRGLASRIVLTAYWLVSGYGLRAWRSLVALAVVTALFAVAFHFIGFVEPPEPATYWTSLLYAFRSTVSLTDDQVTLTAWGSFVQALLRITGPVLLGLLLLALRNRVKR
jgi:uncharacterized protein YjbI with pentapeptide repeats